MTAGPKGVAVTSRGVKSVLVGGFDLVIKIDTVRPSSVAKLKKAIATLARCCCLLAWLASASSSGVLETLQYEADRSELMLSTGEVDEGKRLEVVYQENGAGSTRLQRAVTSKWSEEEINLGQIQAENLEEKVEPQ